MQDQLYEILSYLKGALKYKWVAIIIAWVICVGGWLFVSSMPNKYTSEAKVHVDTRSMLQPLLSGMTIDTDVRGLLRVMQQLMFTKGNLEQIIRLSDIGKASITAIEQEKLIAGLKSSIHIAGGADDMFTITYEANSPNEAKNVVQAVLTVFSEQTQLSTLGSTDSAQRFIDEQIQEYEMRLRNGEKARENFKRANLGLLPGEGGGAGGQIAKIQDITSQIEDAKLALKEAMSRKDALKSQLTEALTSGDEEEDEWGDATGTSSALDDPQIALLKQRKEELLIKYTENHPDIVYINKTIKKMQGRNSQKQANVEEAGGLETGVLTNPYIQSIKIALNEADATISSINSRIETFQARLQKAQEELNARLSIETEIENLNRDYAAIKSNYERLLLSKETAAMSEKVDIQAEALKFKLADAPNTPLQPSSPKRKLLYSGVLILGVLFGWAVAFLLYLIRPTIMSVSQLRQITGLPILGNVSLKPSVAQTIANRKAALSYSITTIGLLIIYVGFMTVDFLEIKQLNLAYLFQKIH
ncbi:MAG: hypothetical protein NTV43_09515 [Methylococcales bacterium]|nr:hypothetical protein [Methylococcales bacterium]